MIHLAKNILSVAGLSGLALGLLAVPAWAAQPMAVPANLPLFFEAGQEQAGAPAQFVARGHDYQFLVSATSAQIVLRKPVVGSAAVRMQFTGANPQAQIRGDGELPGKVNYLTGNDRARWRVGMSMFAKVRVGELYPGINLVYYGNQQQLEYDFDIAPESDPNAIAIHFDGADKVSIDPRGDLILSLAGREIRQPRPAVYQVVGGVRKEIESGYRLVDAHTVAFAIGNYDHSQSLIIDPVLGFSTYFGGNFGDTAWAIALSPDVTDTNGFIYIAGQTFSKQISTNESFSTTGAYQTNFAGGRLTGDAFVFKLDVASGIPVYITYLGGSADDAAYAIAVDAAGNAYVTGVTDSTNFPTTSNTNATPTSGLSTNIHGIFDKSFGSVPSDAFVAKLSPDGSSLRYSTYLGGSGMDTANGIAVDSSGNAYVTGYTYSSNYPAMSALGPAVNAYQDHLACTNSIYFNANAFITEIASNGTSLIFSTYFGGTNFDVGAAIAVDTNNYIYVTGFTASTNFPTTNFISQQLVQTNQVTVTITNVFNGSLLNGSTNKTPQYDAFVAKFAPSGTNLEYSTLLGGTNNDMAYSIAVDNNGSAYVTGWTISTNFPNTMGTNIVVGTNTGIYSFVATNTSLVVVATNVFLTKIIVTNGTFTVTNGASVITNYNPAYIAWSVMFGGNGADIGYGVALDPAGNDVFVTGSASSTNFPVCNVPGLMSATNSGKCDAFVIAFTNDASKVLYSGYLGGKDDDFGYGIAVDTNDNAYVVGQTLSTNFPSFNGGRTTRDGTNDAFLTQIILNPGLPSITTQPATNQIVAVGAFVPFSVAATGTPPLFYQWQRYLTNMVTVTNVVSGTNLVTTNVLGWINLVDGTNISGATNDTLNINPAQTTNSGNYQVIVDNFGGSVTSLVASLTVTNVPPEITQPLNQTNGAGSSAVFSITVTNGTAPFHYQWQEADTNSVSGWTNLANGGRISGANSNMLTISKVQTNDNGTSYSVIVTNYGGSATSSVAVLTVQTTPLILVQPTPTNQAMAVGATAALTVTAVGTVPLHYQWKLNGTNVVNVIGHIIGATTNLLVISNAQTNNSGTYTVVITNVDGALTSSVANVLVTNVPPGITQPISQTNGVGTTVVIFVIPTNGTPPLHYQWQLFGTNMANLSGRITGATSNLLTLSKVQLTNSGDYTVIVTNYGGSVTSSIATLTVVSTPIITMQPTPTNQSLAVGATMALAVSAVGTVPLHYQWKLNGTNVANVPNHIIGATTNVLLIGNVQTTNADTYTVVVTNVAGSVTSSNAYVTVTNVPPAIGVQPLSQIVAGGVAVNLSVTVTNGTPPLYYQWQFNGTNLVISGRRSQISGQNASQLIFRSAQATNSGDYTVIITNFAGSVTSSIAVLTVAATPLITSQPTNLTLAAGSTATFAVSAIGTAPLHYQWQLNGNNVSNATSRVLTLNNVQTNDSGTYSVIVSNRIGSVISSNAVLTVVAAPLIQEQPTNQMVAVGSTATFTVTAIGAPPLSYQWQLDGTNLVDGDITSGSATSALTISNAQTNNTSTNYTVIVSNSFGSVTSSPVALTVVRLMVIAWGDDDSGQTDVPLDLTNVMTAIAGGGFHCLALRTNGTVVAWGDNTYGQTDVPADLTNAVAIAAGYVHSLALRADGTVTGWGAGTNNTGSFPEYGQVMVPADLTNVVAISAGFFHNLALQANGTVLAWGDNTYGQTNVPPDLTNVVAIAGSGYVSLALTANGTVVAWGNNGFGQTNVPADLTNVVAIAGGSDHCLALLANGAVVAWGAGQTNNPSDQVDFGQAIVPVGLSNVVAIAGGGLHSLALLANGAVVAWGAGQTNNPSDQVDFGQAIVPVDLTNVVAIAGGYFHSLALENDGSPYIVRQPAGQTDLTNTTVTFTVTALGAPTLTYQWQKDGTGLVDGGNVSGSATATLTLTDVQTTDAAAYDVVITNAIGSVTSSNANLTVTDVAPAIIQQPLTSETTWSPIIRCIRLTSDGKITIAGDSGGGGAQADIAGDTNLGTYYVLASSNLLTPLTNWTLIATNQFDGAGSFIFTNPAPTNAPQEFYRLQLP
jgi:alpha-tubulin suppressor-like RCC1 family protein